MGLIRKAYRACAVRCYRDPVAVGRVIVSSVPKPSLVNISFAVYTFEVRLTQRPIQRIGKVARAQCQGVGLPAAAIT
jgi:hypothetical protein